jgi:DNA-binding MarR family transcriptional regulator
MNERDTTPDACAQRVARECFALRVQVLNRAVTRLYDEALRPLGLTLNQLSILTALTKMGAAQPGDVGRVLQMEKSTVSRNVKRLRQQKWVRESRGSDARRVQLSITEKGRSLLVRALPLWERAQAGARQLLGGASAGPAAITSITELVDRFVMNANKQ